MLNQEIWKRQADIICRVLEKAPEIDLNGRLPPEEFTARQRETWRMLQDAGADCGIVYSDEHYCGDVPYLAGNSNVIVEPIAAVLGKNGLYFIAGLESGIVAEQLCHRSGVVIRKVDILRVGDADYPAGLLTPAEIIEEACGKRPEKIALLTPSGVFPLGLYRAVSRYVGEAGVVDLSRQYGRIKYEKSDCEMKLIEEACQISDVMLEGMLRILRPGMRETQVAAWGYAIAHELGVEEMGFRIMVTSGPNNRTIVARASNRVIGEGEVVHIGVAPKRDGLCGAQRTSVLCVKNPGCVPAYHRTWMRFLTGAYAFAQEQFQRIARENLLGSAHEKAMIEYYTAHAPALEKELGISLPNFHELKGYVTTHNSGYTECQEGYGALSCEFNEPCAKQMVLMLDVGVKGFGTCWADVRIPGLDYLVIEKTAGKFGEAVRILNRLPVDLQPLVGEAF